MFAYIRAWLRARMHVRVRAHLHALAYVVPACARASYFLACMRVMEHMRQWAHAFACMIERVHVVWICVSV